MGSKGATIPKSDPGDFGWRLHGRSIGTLPDRSFDLASTGLDGEFLKALLLGRRDAAIVSAVRRVHGDLRACGRRKPVPAAPGDVRTPRVTGPACRRPRHMALLRLHRMLGPVPFGRQTGQHHERAQAVRHGPVRPPASSGARRQQPPALLDRVRGRRGLPRGARRRQRLFQPWTRPARLCRDDPQLDAHPRFHRAHGVALDRGRRQCGAGLALLVRRIVVQHQRASALARDEMRRGRDPRPPQARHLHDAPASALGPPLGPVCFPWPGRGLRRDGAAIGLRAGLSVVDRQPDKAREQPVRSHADRGCRLLPRWRGWSSRLAAAGADSRTGPFS